MTKTLVYALKTCPACLKLKQELLERGEEFEERQVDENQAWLDEALKYGDMVPITVYGDGKVKIGYGGMIGCYIA